MTVQLDVTERTFQIFYLDSSVCCIFYCCKKVVISWVKWYCECTVNYPAWNKITQSKLWFWGYRNNWNNRTKWMVQYTVNHSWRLLFIEFPTVIKADCLLKIIVKSRLSLIVRVNVVLKNCWCWQWLTFRQPVQ